MHAGSCRSSKHPQRDCGGCASGAEPQEALRSSCTARISLGVNVKGRFRVYEHGRMEPGVLHVRRRLQLSRSTASCGRSLASTACRASDPRELLDDLPIANRLAIRVHRNLRRVNGWMRNPKVIARPLLAVRGRNRHALLRPHQGQSADLPARIKELVQRPSKEQSGGHSEAAS